MATRTLQDLWFRAGPPVSGARGSVVCFPHAGGGASVFRHWKTHFDDGVEVLAVQYPGHEGRWRERPVHEVQDIADPLAEAIAARAQSPFVLFGHSLGALIAFETVRALRRNGFGEPHHLFVSGSRAPDIASTRDAIHAEPDGVFLGHMRELGGVPEEVLAHSQLVEMLLPVLRAGMKMDAVYRYREEPPLNCDITAFLGTEDRDATVEQAAGWSRHTARSFQLHTYAAGHWWPPECERSILRIIQSVLNRLAEHAQFAC